MSNPAVTARSKFAVLGDWQKNALLEFNSHILVPKTEWSLFISGDTNLGTVIM